MTHHVRRFVGMIAVLVAGIASTAQGFTTGNLLTDPSFENNALISYSGILGSPYAENAWGAEDGSIVGAESGITPADGVSMLRLVNDGGTTTQAWQLINLSAYAAYINAGLASMDLEALFNIPASVAAGQSAETLQFFGSSHAQIGSTFSATSNLTYGSLDSLTGTWQALNLTGISVPVNTVYALTQVYFGNVSMGGQPGYVDATSLSLTAIPEPSSIALLGLGFVGLAGVARVGRKGGRK